MSRDATVLRSPRMAERRRAVRAERRRRRRRATAVAVLVVGVGSGAFALTRSSVFALQGIRVVGNRSVPAAAVIAASGLRTGQRVVGLDIRTAAARVERLAQVADARVERDGALGLRIVVVERTPAVEIRWAAGRAYLDASGDGIEWAAAGDRVPVIDVPGWYTRDAPHVVGPEGVRAVASLWRALPGRWRRRITSFSVPVGERLAFDLGGARVTFGRAERVREKLSALELLLRYAARRGDRLVEADVRAPSRPAARFA